MAGIVGFLEGPSVGLVNGTNIVNLTGGIDASFVDSGTAVYIDNVLFEGIAGTSADGGGLSTITLRNNYTGTTIVAGVLLAFNTIEGLRDAIRKARNLTTDTQSFLTKIELLLTSTNPTESILINGVATNIVPFGFLESQTTTLLASLTSLTGVAGVSGITGVRSAAEFFALAEKRIRNNAGSGSSEWGKHSGNTTHGRINEGAWTVSDENPSSASNALYLGNFVSSDEGGISRVAVPIVLVNGVILKIDQLNSNNSIGNTIKFPDAPDGLDKNDGTRYADLATAIADGTTALSNSVLSRQDFVFLEVWHEKVTDKDVVYPLGNVQYGVSTWESITLSNAVEVQGYSAFGDWDTTTKGFGVAWVSLSDANKSKFIDDHDNNIYIDDGVLVQVRYRIRVIKGLGDNWDNVSPQLPTHLRYNSTTLLSPRGIKTVFADFVDGTDTSNNGINRLIVATVSPTMLHPVEIGEFGVAKWISSDLPTISHNNLCFSIPIALVQRKNKGAYHPAYNPEGTSTIATEAEGTAGSTFWHSSNTKLGLTTTSDIFTWTSLIDPGGIGKIGGFSGRPDSRFYDAIYASDVQDLRMSSKRLPHKEIREKYKRMAIAGEVRGFEGVPFTKVTVASLTGNVTLGIATDSIAQIQFNVDAISGNAIYIEQVGGTYNHYLAISGVGEFAGNLVVNAASLPTDRFEGQHIVVARAQTHKQAKPTWTDIIGDPVNIAATFPNGVEGKWIPELSTLQSLPLNRKMLNGLAAEWTNTNGTSWNTATPMFNTVTNEETTTWTTITVALIHYETQAHFTEDAVNSEVLDLGRVFATQLYTADNAFLISGLIGKVAFTNTAWQGVNLSVLGVDNVSGKLYTGGTLTKRVAHATISLGSSDTPTVKTLDYLSHDGNGLLTLNYVYKEMVWDSSKDFNSDFVSVDNTTAFNYVQDVIYNINTSSGTQAWLHVGPTLVRTFSALFVNGDTVSNSTGTVYFTRWNGNGFGDNNQFEIVDNQSTFTDDNGSSAVFGTANFKTQHFYVPN